MVREEVIHFKIPKALYDMGQAVVDTGGADSQSAFSLSSVSNQVSVDLMALNTGKPFAVRECRTEYSKGRGSDWRMMSVRVNSSVQEVVDVMVSYGAAESRSEYFRRAYAEEVRRRRDVPQGYADMEARLLSGDAFKRAVIDIVKELLLEMFSPILHLHKK